jgi:hypothetical protein
MHRPLRFAAPFAAVTLAVGLTLGGTGIAAAGSPGQYAQAGRMVGAGRTASRSAVPWSKVGRGWTLVTYTTANPYAAQPKPGATTLFLVDPAGGKYVMYRWPRVPADSGVYLIDWSGDGKRAMLEAPKTRKSSAEQLEQLTLASGKLTRLQLPASVDPVSYTRPDGQAALAYRFLASPLRVQLVRYALSGKLEKVLFTLKPTSNSGGFLNLRLSSPYDPSGTEIALTAAPAGATGTERTVLISNAGGLIRRYRQASSCEFVGWWSASQLLTANCARTRLFLTPVSGAKPTPLTPASTSPYRYVNDAWRLGGHVYVQQNGVACGSGSVGVLRSGQLANVTVPKIPNGPTIVTASASKFLIATEGCMGSSGLLWFNPANSSEVQVLNRNQGQGVVDWVPYYELNRG